MNTEIDYQSEVKKRYPDAVCLSMWGWHVIKENKNIMDGCNTLSDSKPFESDAWKSAYEKIVNQKQT